GGERKIVPRREADYATSSWLRLSDQQPHALDVETILRRVRLQCGEVVVKNESRGIGRITNSASPRVSRAKIAIRVVGRLGRARQRPDFSLPRPHGAVRRDQHPLVGQRIQPAMRIFGEFHVGNLAPFYDEDGPYSASPEKNLQLADFAGPYIRISAARGIIVGKHALDREPTDATNPNFRVPLCARGSSALRRLRSREQQVAADILH